MLAKSDIISSKSILQPSSYSIERRLKFDVRSCVLLDLK